MSFTWLLVGRITVAVPALNPGMLTKLWDKSDYCMDICCVPLCNMVQNNKIKNTASMTNKIVQTSVAEKKKVPLINLFSFTGKNAEKLEKNISSLRPVFKFSKSSL